MVYGVPYLILSFWKYFWGEKHFSRRNSSFGADSYFLVPISVSLADKSLLLAAAAVQLMCFELDCTVLT